MFSVISTFYWEKEPNSFQRHYYSPEQRHISHAALILICASVIHPEIFQCD